MTDRIFSLFPLQCKASQIPYKPVAAAAGGGGEFEVNPGVRSAERSAIAAGEEVDAVAGLAAATALAAAAVAQALRHRPVLDSGASESFVFVDPPLERQREFDLASSKGLSPLLADTSILPGTYDNPSDVAALSER